GGSSARAHTRSSPRGFEAAEVGRRCESLPERGKLRDAGIILQIALPINLILSWRIPPGFQRSSRFRAASWHDAPSQWPGANPSGAPHGPAIAPPLVPPDEGGIQGFFDCPGIWRAARAG